MQNRRAIGFTFSILLGILAGLLYGWFIDPPAPKNSALSDLREDYRTDAVLMVAEKYSTDGDILWADSFLRSIAATEPRITVKSAMILAEQYGYALNEQQLLFILENALESGANSTGGATP